MRILDDEEIGMDLLGSRIQLISSVPGLVSEGKRVRAALERFKPQAMTIPLPREQLFALEKHVNATGEEDQKKTQKERDILEPDDERETRMDEDNGEGAQDVKNDADANVEKNAKVAKNDEDDGANEDDNYEDAEDDEDDEYDIDKDGDDDNYDDEDDESHDDIEDHCPSRYEEIYSRYLANFGEVKAPPTEYIEALDYCRKNAIPLIAIDMSEERYTLEYCSKISGRELVEHSIRIRKLKHRRYPADSPQKFALAWDRDITSIKGFERLEKAREKHMAEEIFRIIPRYKTMAVLLEVPRLEGVKDMLMAFEKGDLKPTKRSIKMKGKGKKTLRTVGE